MPEGRLYTATDGMSAEKALMPSRSSGPVRRWLLLAGGSLLFCTAAGDGGDKREQQLADRLVTRIEQGEPVRLEADGREFLALHQPVFGALPRHAVLLVHNMGGHPDWPEVVSPLRTGLPEAGWSTLSLQMPLLAPRALADDYGRTVNEAVRRIASGVGFLRRQGYACVVLAGYGFGASEALAYLAQQEDADGLITVSVLAREFLQPSIDLPSLLARIRMPVLDIYGREDFPEVIEQAHDRRTAVKNNGTAEYEQRVIDGADHYFTDRDRQLVDTVVAWLDATYSDRRCRPDKANSA